MGLAILSEYQLFKGFSGNTRKLGTWKIEATISFWKAHICNLQKVSPAEELREDWTRIPLSPWAQNMWSSLWKLCTLHIYGAYILYAVHIPLRILLSQKSVPSPSVCNCPDFFDKHFANTPKGKKLKVLKGKTVRSYWSSMILQFYDYITLQLENLERNPAVLWCARDNDDPHL